MNFFQVAAEQPTIQPDTLFSIGTLPVTNAMITGVMVTLLFAVMCAIVTKKKSLVPGGFQAMVESVVEAFIGLLESITGQRAYALALLPIIGALFLFMAVSNLILLIPGLGSITVDGVALLRTPTNDFNTTFSIAFAMIIVTQVASIKAYGLFGHIGKYIKIKEVFLGFKEGIGAGMLAIIDFLIGLLDVISEIAKVVSLSLRLFGNMYAGEVLAAIFLGAFALFIPAPWLAMNILVGILQALVFGALTAAYFTLAVPTEDRA